ncbi:MAG: AI-2E family transporter [Bdellovibrionales bacterium]|nr:AI-2E family transporter [Ramlibacter sp.]
MEISSIPPASTPADPATPPESPTVPSSVAPEIDEPPHARPPIMLHMPVDVRSLSMAVIAVIATLWLLHWARDVFIPVMMAIMFSYALTPVVDWLVRRRIPRAAAAGLLLTALLAAMGGTGYTLSDDTSKLLQSLPEATQKLRSALRSKVNAQESTLDKVKKAAAELEKTAQENSSSPAAAKGVTRVQIEQVHFKVSDYLWTGTVGLLSLIGQIVLVFLITFFLLASGDTFRRKMVKIAGPTFTKKKITIQAMDEITEQIQRYLLVQLFTSVLVGIASWLAFWAIGLEHSAVWGVVSGVTNLVPYVGSAATTVAAALVAFTQFGTINMALAVAAASLIIHSISGYLITPWLTSRASRINPVVVFVGVLAFGWLWGVWGLLLGVPVIMAIKAICDRVEDLNSMGELLGR